MIAVNQLCSVKILGELDGQACDNPLWFITDAPAGIAIATVAKRVANVWRTKILPHLSDKYEFLRVEAQSLAGLEIMTKGSDAAPEYKTTRMNWAERFIWNVNEVGGVTSPAHAGFVALSVIKTVGTAYLIDPETGVETNTYSVRNKNGAMRVGGISEIDTLTTEPNRISSAAYNKFFPGLALLRDFQVNQAAEPYDIDPSDIGKSLHMRVVSSTRNNGPRLDKSGGPDVTDWAPAWTSSDVNGMTLHRFVGSQVSRKRSNSRRG